jgi:hypothetical protein
VSPCTTSASATIGAEFAGKHGGGKIFPLDKAEVTA